MLFGGGIRQRRLPCKDWKIATNLESKIISWRRDIHAYPELGNREFRTSALVAEHLTNLGFDEVQTGIAHTGVVGILHVWFED